MGVCEEGRLGSFRTPNNNSEKEPVDAKRVKRKDRGGGGGGVGDQPPAGCSLSLCVARCLARSDLDAVGAGTEGAPR